MRRALSRGVLAVWVLLSFGVSYAAPLELVLLVNGSGMSCCRGAKAGCCCRRSHAPGWIGDRSGCPGQCGVSLGASPAAALLAAPRGPCAEALPVRQPLAAALPPAPKSSSYPAFLYQLPPPAC